jgi:hypothetical protein
MVTSIQRIQQYTYLNRSLNKLRCIVTTADTSIGATEFHGIFQLMEGLKICDLGYGAAGAIPLVARFTWQGPAGTYAFSMRNHVPNRSFIKNFTIIAGQANTPQIITISIPGEITGSWVTGNSLGVIAGVFTAVGSSYIGTDGVWQAGDLRAAAGITNNVGTVGNTFELSDIGLYPDPDATGIAPPWIAPEFQNDLLESRRFYNILYTIVIETSGLSQSITFPDMRTVPVVTNTTGN